MDIDFRGQFILKLYDFKINLCERLFIHGKLFEKVDFIGKTLKVMLVATLRVIVKLTSSIKCSAGSSIIMDKKTTFA